MEMFRPHLRAGRRWEVTSSLQFHMKVFCLVGVGEYKGESLAEDAERKLLCSFKRSAALSPRQTHIWCVRLAMREFNGEALAAVAGWTTLEVVNPVQSDRQCGSCWFPQYAWALRASTVVPLSTPRFDVATPRLQVATLR